MIALIQAEILKLKRTLALQMVVIAPALVLILALFIALRSNEPVNGEIDPWTKLNGSALVLWNLLMVPLVITLQSALTGFTEHSNSMWKYLFTLPFGRWQFFVAKFTVNALLIGLAQLCFILMLFLSGHLILLLKADLGYRSAVPWDQLVTPALHAYVCSLLLVAIHTWVSLRFRSIVISLGTGIAGAVASMLVVSSEYSIYFPWTIPGFIAMLSVDRANLSGVGDPLAFAATYLVAMVPIALIAVALGSLEFARHDAQ